MPYLFPLRSASVKLPTDFLASSAKPNERACCEMGWKALARANRTARTTMK